MRQRASFTSTLPQRPNSSNPLHIVYPTSIPSIILTVAPKMARDPVQLLAQADKAYSSADSGFSWFGSRTEKYENAAELYISAGGAYRLQQAGQEAGMAYEKVALPSLSPAPTSYLVLTATPRRPIFKVPSSANPTTWQIHSKMPSKHTERPAPKTQRDVCLKLSTITCRNPISEEQRRKSKS